MPSPTVTFLLFSVALLLLPSDPNGVVVAAPSDEGKHDEEVDIISTAGDHYGGEEYESKMEQALSYYASESQDLLDRTLLEGGATAAMEIDSDGNLVVDNSNSGDGEEYWQGEVALDLLEEGLDVIFDTRFGTENEGDEADSEQDELLNNDPELITILSAIENKAVQNELYADIVDQAKRKATLEKRPWDTYTYWELHAYFSCFRVFAGSRPIYDTEKWNEVRQFYHEFTKNDKEDRSYDENNPKRTYQFSTESFDPPIEPFQAGGEKGRAIRAVREISKGEMVFKATNNTVIFTHGHTWRKFLFAIDKKYDSGTTCDVLVWSWVQTLKEGGPVVIVADLDNGSLLNEGRGADKGWDLPNVRCGKEGDTMCMLEYYATKDIQVEDELLCDYRGFAMLDSWADMGLM